VDVHNCRTIAIFPSRVPNTLAAQDRPSGIKSTYLSGKTMMARIRTADRLHVESERGDHLGSKSPER
jgi:hypothetical protein